MPEPFRKLSNSTAEPKSRGANRSTKIGGKLKVLPEQPESLPQLDSKTNIKAAERLQTESTATTGESDEGEAESNDEPDVEVTSSAYLVLKTSSLMTWLDL